MKAFSIDSPLMQFLSKMADFILMSMLLVIFSLPVFTIGPAVTALYCVLIKRSNGYEGSIIPAFWKALKDNFKNSLLIELIFVPIMIISGLLVYFVSTGLGSNSIIVLIVCFLPGVLTVFALSYVFPLNAQFDNTPQNTVKNSYIMSIGNLPISISVAIINLLPVLLALVNLEFLKKALPYLSLIGFSLMAWTVEKLLHKVFKQYFPEPNEYPEESELTEGTYSSYDQ